MADRQRDKQTDTHRMQIYFEYIGIFDKYLTSPSNNDLLEWAVKQQDWMREFWIMTEDLCLGRLCKWRQWEDDCWRTQLSWTHQCPISWCCPGTHRAPSRARSPRRTRAPWWWWCSGCWCGSRTCYRPPWWCSSPSHPLHPHLHLPHLLVDHQLEAQGQLLGLCLKEIDIN